MSIASLSAAAPLRFLGAPLGAWGFALRNWLAMMLAIYVAFWLQLDGASSAATCVAILALQTRGQAFEKAIYRLGGTIVGATASIVIAGCFNETRTLFFAACCLWFGLCVTLASMLDGNRAYGAVLSGYTVAIVALPNIDSPANTFSSGINQGAAIAIGIIAMAVVSDVFRAPELFPKVLMQLENAHGKVAAFAATALRSGASPTAAVRLQREITALHPDISALSTESVSGRARYQSACLAANAMLRTVSAAHVVAAALSDLGDAAREPQRNLVEALEGRDHRSVRQHAIDVLQDMNAPADRLVAASACLVLFEQNDEATTALSALRTGQWPARVAHLTAYRSRRAALRNGLRAALALAVPMLLLSWLDWPATTTILVQIGTLVGLSATNPNPRAFAIGAVTTVPLAVASVGITEFLILDGVDQFQLLVLGMGPVIIIASLLLASGQPKLYGIGFLLMVFFTVILSPANPQGYNPQVYLIVSFLSILAAIALFILLSTLLPTSDARRRDWIVESATSDLRDALVGKRRHLDPPASTFRDADRIGQLGSLHTGADQDADLVRVIRTSDLAGCARRAWSALGRDRGMRAFASRVGPALASLDPGHLRELAREMLIASHSRADGNARIERQAAIDLLFAATLVEQSPDLVASLHAEPVR